MDSFADGERAHTHVHHTPPLGLVDPRTNPFQDYVLVCFMPILERRKEMEMNEQFFCQSSFGVSLAFAVCFENAPNSM